MAHEEEVAAARLDPDEDQDMEPHELRREHAFADHAMRRHRLVAADLQGPEPAVIMHRNRLLDEDPGGEEPRAREGGDGAGAGAYLFQYRRLRQRAAAAAAAQRPHAHHAVEEVDAWLQRGMGMGGAGLGPGSQALVQQQEQVDSFSDDEGSDEAMDTTAEQLKQGKDIQGIPWERLQFTRDSYRAMRLRSFRNYTNVLPDDAAEYRADILATARPAAPRRGGRFFDFVRNSRSVQSTIVHFQLRNLVWAESRNDVFVVHENCVTHWNPVTRELRPVLDMTGGQQSRRLPGVGAVQVSSMCIKDGLLAVGGFHGELVVLSLHDLTTSFSSRVTRSDNGITNGIEVCDVRGAGHCVLASNNDCMLRLYTADTFQVATQVQFPWPVNYAAMDPSGRVAAVVGDNEVAQLTEMRSGSSRPVAQLKAHRDYSFAVAWHPDGTLLATGNQDTTAAVWDMRRLDQPLARLVGHMGAIRSLRFSPDGRFLAMAEPADFVHIYDVHAGFKQVQEVDLFGEISGISFSPHADAFFVGVADLTYSSLLEFDRHWDTQGPAGAQGGWGV